MSELPEVLINKPLNRPINQRCSTDILQPTTISQSYCKFVLPQQGILDANSQLHLAQIVVDSADPTLFTQSYLPTSTGIASCIQRCYMTINGAEVSDVRDLNHYHTYRRLHYSNEYRQGVSNVHSGGNDTFVGSAGLIDTSASPDSKIARGFLPPYGSIGRESSEFGISTIDATDLGNPDNAYIQSNDLPKRLISNVASETPGFLIGLAELIPALIGFQVPLFTIEGEVAIVIEWSPDTWGHRFMYNGSASVGVSDKDNLKSTIVEDEVFLVMDTLYYPELMEELKDQVYSRGGYSVPYDAVLTQQSFFKYEENAGTTTKDAQIPLSGKQVKRIVVQKASDQENVVEALTSGYYNSLALRTGEEYNFRIDNNNVYSIPLKNVSLQRHEANQVEGIPLVLSSALYSFENQASQTDGAMNINDRHITTRLCNSHTQSNEIGTQHWIGYKIENEFGVGHKMSNYPVIYTEKGRLTANDAGTGATPNRVSNRTIRFFCLYQKVMNINQGIVETIG